MNGSGVMFPIKCKDDLPVDHILIKSISVRGQLGPLTVWVTKDPTTQETPDLSSTLLSLSKACTMKSKKVNKAKREEKIRQHGILMLKENRLIAHPSQWTKIYEKTHAPSFRTYQRLDLSDNPIILKPGEIRGVYVHSSRPGDESIVYDNYGRAQDRDDTPEDNFVAILPALAHVSEEPFGTVTIWGWGNPWRQQRKFVGNIEYGVVYRLWNPQEHQVFGNNFKYAALNLFACQRRFESPISRLPDDCIFYILNMCRWDWLNDTSQGMRICAKKRQEKQKLLTGTQNTTTKGDDEKLQRNEDQGMDHDSDAGTEVLEDMDLTADEYNSSSDSDYNSGEESMEYNSDEESMEHNPNLDIMELMNAPILYNELTSDNDEDDTSERRPTSWLRNVTPHSAFHAFFARYGRMGSNLFNDRGDYYVFDDDFSEEDDDE